MSSVQISGPIAFLAQSGSAVTFTPAFAENPAGTSPKVKEFTNLLGIAPWGEDNRFPQNIVALMDYYGVGKAALNWKAETMYGNGILPGRITGWDAEKNQDIFEPLDRKEYKHVYQFIEAPWFHRFMLEYLQDFEWFSNCFPEAIFTNDCTKITHLVHQEAVNCRYKAMNAQGKIPSVFISYFWGMTDEDMVKFNPKKRVSGMATNNSGMNLSKSDFKEVACVDMYNAKRSLKEIAASLKNKKGLKSAILSNNYPSPGKTYYQLPAWDGSRLAGWIDIAIRIPEMQKLMYKNAFKLRWHIEIPETYFIEKYGSDAWMKMKEEERSAKKVQLLEAMDNFLTGEESAYKSFVSFFTIDQYKGTESGRVKITAIESKTDIDKEMLASSAADNQFMAAINMHSDLNGVGRIATGQQRSGGSNLREIFLIYINSLKLRREVAFSPIYAVRDFNQWGDDIIFRVKDFVLTTLDTGGGTDKTLS